MSSFGRDCVGLMLGVCVEFVCVCFRMVVFDVEFDGDSFWVDDFGLYRVE